MDLESNEYEHDITSEDLDIDEDEIEEYEDELPEEVEDIANKEVTFDNVAEKVGINELVQRNYKIQRLMELLNKTGTDFDTFVQNDPELKDAMEAMMKNNIRFDQEIVDEDIDVDEDDEDDEGEDIEIDDNDIDVPNPDDIEEEDESTSDEVSNDLNSLF